MVYLAKEGVVVLREVMANYANLIAQRIGVIGLSFQVELLPSFGIELRFRPCLKPVQTGSIDQTGSYWIKLVQIGSNWFKPVQTRSIWFKLVQTGSNRFKLVQTGSNQFKPV